MATDSLFRWMAIEDKRDVEWLAKSLGKSEKEPYRGPTYDTEEIPVLRGKELEEYHEGK